jgi:dienelactone hydrolase
MRYTYITLALGFFPQLVCSAPDYPDKTSLLVWKDDKGQDHSLRNREDWSKRRGHILANMEKVMGMLPAKKPITLVYLDEAKTTKFTRKKLAFRPEGYEPITAYLFLPTTATGKTPAVLCLHQTNGRLGGKEPAGLGGKPNLHYALELAERGYVTLAPDYPSFGEYAHDFKTSPFLSGSMKAVWNNMLAIDLLQTLPEVGAGRIAAIGHSLGGHNAIFTAAFDTRIAAVVSSCGFTSFPKYYGGKLKGWTSDRYMPRIAALFDSSPEKVPFDFPEVVAAVAPRAFLTCSPLKDDNFEVSGVKDCIAAARPVYELLGAKDKLAAIYPDCGHDFPAEVRKAAYEFLDRWLK